MDLLEQRGEHLHIMRSVLLLLSLCSIWSDGLVRDDDLRNKRQRGKGERGDGNILTFCLKLKSGTAVVANIEQREAELNDSSLTLIEKTDAHSRLKLRM